MRRRFLVLMASMLFALFSAGGVHADDSPSASTSESSADASEKTSASNVNGSSPSDQTSATSSPSATPSESAREARVAEIRVSGLLEDAPSSLGLFGEISPNLYQLLQRLDSARKDDQVQAVWLELRNPVIGTARVQEIRAAIARLREAGKKVFANVQEPMAADYMIASSCDQIIMPESGMLVIPGVRAEVYFYHDLFEKAGIKADMLQIGQYKGAAEPYSRSGMSEPFRQQLEMIVDDLYDHVVDTIALDRKLPRDKVRALIDQGLLTARQAKEAGLIDQVAYDDQVTDHLRSSLSAEKIAMVDDYGKRKVETDFSGMTGFLKLIELFAGGKAASAGSRGKKIAVIYATGPIMTGSSQIDLFGGTIVGSDTLVRALQKADEDESVQAVVLRVNSPGGSALASDLIWRAIRNMKKPTVASMSDTAASGGYYISMACDKIVAEPTTLTGSIGVVGGKIAVNGLLDKLGISHEHVSRGENVGIFTSGDPLSESERAALKTLMEEIYEQFTSKVRQCRGISEQQLESVAQGRIWTGRQAQRHGLVDELGGLRDAVNLAKKLAGVPEDEELELMVLPEPKSFLEQLIESPEARYPAGAAVPQWLRQSDLFQPIRALEGLRPILSEPAFLCLPYHIRVR